MKHAGTVLVSAFLLLIAGRTGLSQTPFPPSALTERGTVSVSGKEVPYVIRRLPVSSFPQLPEPIATELEKLGCMIPQTYEAHRPENVVEGSFERTGSSDWAVLCSTRGTAKLMVFFGSALESGPTVLATEPETARLVRHDPTDVMGFAWGIDPATPQQVREAQSGMQHRGPRLDHDAVADTFVEKATVYHFFARNSWEVIDTTD